MFILFEVFLSFHNYHEEKSAAKCRLGFRLVDPTRLFMYYAQNTQTGLY